MHREFVVLVHKISCVFNSAPRRRTATSRREKEIAPKRANANHNPHFGRASSTINHAPDRSNAEELAQLFRRWVGGGAWGRVEMGLLLHLETTELAVPCLELCHLRRAHRGPRAVAGLAQVLV